MVSLFLKEATNFNNNGKVLNEWIKDSLKITESLDGIFDLEGDYPIQDSKNFSQYLVRGNIIRSPVYDSRPDQLFRIRKTTVNSSDSKISVYAQAIARCDLMNDFVFGGGSSPLVPAGNTRKQAIGLVLAAVQDNVGKFNVGNLDANTNTSINLGLDENTGNVINYIDVSYVSPLTGILDNSSNAKTVYNAYGGEIIFNNFTIDMVDERGNDNSFDIKSGKNLQEFEQDIDDTSDDFATVLIMVSSDGIHLPNNELITSPNVGILGNKYKVITCDDVSAVDNSTAALNIVYDQLRERGQNKFSVDGIDSLTINNTVKFAQLKKTEEYENYDILEKCELGNNITIIYKKLSNLTAIARVTQIVYNPLALNGKGKITEVTIGNRKKKSIVDIINNNTDTTSQNTSDINDTKARIKKTNKSVSDLTVTMQQNDDSILLEVRNNKTDTDAAIEVMDGEIQQRVTKGDFGSYITQNYDSVTEAIVDATGSHTCTFNNTGLTVQNGGIKIKNNSGTIVFFADDNGNLVLKDLTLDTTATANNSKFVSSLANINHITLSNLSIGGSLIISQDDFNISFSGDTGYNFTQAVEKILENHNLI